MLEQTKHVEPTLPFTLLGLDSDNGGGWLDRVLIPLLGVEEVVALLRAVPARGVD